MLNLNYKESSNGSLLSMILGDEVAAWHVEKLLARSSKLPTADELQRINGIGPTTAQKILAVCELSARYFVGTERSQISNPEDVLSRLSWMKYKEQEYFVAVTLDAANHVIDVHDLTKGTATQTPVTPREAFRPAILDNAVNVIFAHNHPSGSAEPSAEDIALTRVLCAAGKILQIGVFDHLVLGKSGYTSICRQMPELFVQTLKETV